MKFKGGSGDAGTANGWGVGGVGEGERILNTK